MAKTWRETSEEVMAENPAETLKNYVQKCISDIFPEIHLWLVLLKALSVISPIHFFCDFCQSSFSGSPNWLQEFLVGFLPERFSVFAFLKFLPMFYGILLEIDVKFPKLPFPE